MNSHNDRATCPEERRDTDHQECEACGLEACLADCCPVERDGYRTSHRAAAPVVHFVCQKAWEKIESEREAHVAANTPQLVIDIQPNGWSASFDRRPLRERLGERVQGVTGDRAGDAALALLGAFGFRYEGRGK